MDRQGAMDEAVRRLVAYFRPEQIYLLGSSARGDQHPGSDLDFLVVLPDDCPPELLKSGKVYEQMAGIPLPVDIVPCHRRFFEARGNWLMSMPALALREGKLIYDAERRAA